MKTTTRLFAVWAHCGTLFMSPGGKREGSNVASDNVVQLKPRRLDRVSQPKETTRSGEVIFIASYQKSS